MRLATSMVVAVLAVLAGCAAPVGAPGAPNPSGIERRTDDLSVPALDWTDCPDAPVPGVECADLRVPLTYRDPDGRQITLRVSRRPAADPAARRGVLVSNPGGPGAPGLYNTLGVDQLTGGVLRRRYDLVGFDPRGTGESFAQPCALTPEQAAAVSLNTPPVSPQADGAAAREVAAACVTTTETFLSTANTARDMELLRSALDAERLNYSGISGGVSLGATYAAMYPERVDRFLLDSLDDVTRGWYPRLRASHAAIDERFAEVAATLARIRPELGVDDAAVRERWLALMARVEQGGVVFDGIPVTVATLWGRLDLALRNDDEIPLLGEIIAVLDGVPGAPTDLAERLPPEATEADRAEYVRVASAGLQVICGDGPWPSDPQVYTDAVAADAAAYPVSRGVRAKISPCAFWNALTDDPLPVLTDAGHTGRPNILLIQNARDPATPLAGALNVRAALGTRAVMITTSRGGHGVLGIDPCATAAATAWLADGVLPPADTRC